MPPLNLRASRETELAERWPEHVVCAWIGNSRLVARKHYLQVTEAHFEQAAIVPTAGKQQAAQNAAQQSAVLSRTDSQSELVQTVDQQELQELAAQCEIVPKRQAPRGCRNSIHVSSNAEPYA